MVMTSPTDLYTTWLPAALIVVMALVGLIRGVRREAVVSASIVLGALIIEQWADLWASDINSFYNALNKGQEQFILSLVVMLLCVAAVGYGLGSAVSRGSLTSGARLAGGLLGIVNGSALAGWLLRYAYANLDNAQTSSSFYQNPLSQALMVWAGWFPVAIAVIAALAVIIAPLRRAQVAVSRPAPETNWVPSTPPPPSIVPSAAPTAPYAVVPARAPYAPATRTESLPAQDSPDTTLLPATRNVPTAAEPDSSMTRNFATSDSYRSPVAPQPTPRETTSTQTTDHSAWMGPAEPSWLVPSQTGPTESASATTPPNAPQQADTVEASSAGTTQLTDERCPNCGSPITPGARFCTECGTKLTTDES
jgi:uncharacterized membrane protein required for colicin V production